MSLTTVSFVLIESAIVVAITDEVFRYAVFRHIAPKLTSGTSCTRNKIVALKQINIFARKKNRMIERTSVEA